MRSAALLAIVLAFAAPVTAQEIPDAKTMLIAGGVALAAYGVHELDTHLSPLPAGGRPAADVGSWVTLGAAVAADTWSSWKAPDRTRALELEGVRIGVTEATVWAAKHFIHRQRPCAPSDCGNDLPDTSFFSGHTALAFSTVGGPRLAVVLPLAVTTGGLRIGAGRHYFSDVLVGAGVGLLTSRIRP